MMTTSAPPPEASSPWADTKRSNQRTTTAELEVGFSAMSLVSELTGVNGPPTLSGSSLSTVGDEFSSQHHTRTLAATENHSQAGTYHGTPPSPGSPPPRGPRPYSGSSNVFRSDLSHQQRGPVSFPSPIGKGGATNSASSSSSIVKMSSSQSIEGGSDILGMGRQSFALLGDGMSLPPPPNLETGGEMDRTQKNKESEALGGTSIHIIDATTNAPPLSSAPSDDRNLFSGQTSNRLSTGGEDKLEALTGASAHTDSCLSDVGSFDRGTQHSRKVSETGSFDDDGLRGLGALRKRAESSPGPTLVSPGAHSLVSTSSSPPIGSDVISASSFLYRGDSSASSDGHSGLLNDLRGSRSLLPDPKSTRTCMGGSIGGKINSRPPLSGGNNMGGASNKKYSDSSSIGGTLRQQEETRPSSSIQPNSGDRVGTVVSGPSIPAQSTFPPYKPNSIRPDQSERTFNDVSFADGSTNHIAESRMENSLGNIPRAQLRHVSSDVTNAGAPGSGIGSRLLNNGRIVDGGPSQAALSQEMRTLERVGNQQHSQFMGNRVRSVSLGTTSALKDQNQFDQQQQPHQSIYTNPNHGYNQNSDPTANCSADNRRPSSGNELIYGGHGINANPGGHMSSMQHNHQHQQHPPEHGSLQHINSHQSQPQIHTHEHHHIHQHPSFPQMQQHQQQGVPQQPQQAQPQMQATQHHMRSYSQPSSIYQHNSLGYNSHQDRFGRGYDHNHLHQHDSMQRQQQFNNTGMLHRVSGGGHFDTRNGPPQQQIYDSIGHNDGNRHFIMNRMGVRSTDGNRYDGNQYSQHMPCSVSAGSNLVGGANAMGGGVLARPGSRSHHSLSSVSPDGSSHCPSPAHHPQQNVMQGGSGHFSHHSGQGSQLPYQPHPNVQSAMQGHHSHHEFHGGDMGSSTVPVMASPEEMMRMGIGENEMDNHGRGVGGRSRGHSPTLSPHHGVNIADHSRGHGQQHINAGLISASPTHSSRSSNSAMIGRGPSPLSNDSSGPHHHRRRSSYDSDLSHPLAGEHIEDTSLNRGIGMSHGSNVGPQGGIHHHQPHNSGFSAPYIGSSGQGAPHHPHVNSTPQNSGPATAIVPHFSQIEASPQQLTAGACVGGSPRVVYNVKFKRTQRSFILGPRVPRDMKIGCYVKVEADRGEDLGIVVSRIPAEKFNATGRSNFRLGVGSSSGGVAISSSGEISAGVAGPTPVIPGAGGAADLKRIIRLATHDEVSLLAVKREEEEELLKICRGKVRQRCLPMNVVDAEYQFDRHKLTFFFEAEGRIDFRELVRDLFSIYKTRIWMQQLDKNGAASGATGTGIMGSSGNALAVGGSEAIVDNEFEEYCGSNSSDSGDKGRE